jgi:exopolysaccharide biosynthesis polyprenyl glycosylphosphotransferase
MTVRARAFRTPSPRALLLAAATAPLAAVGLHLLSTPGAAAYGALELAGLALVLAAFEAPLGWSGLGRDLLGRDFRAFLGRAVAASAAGLALAWLAVLAVPSLGLGPGDAAVVGICSALLLVAVRAALPVVVEPRRITDGTLILGRGALAAKLCLEFLRGQQASGVPGVTWLDRARRGTRGLSVDPDELKRLVREERITRIVVAEPEVEARREITSALLECRLLGVAVEDAVDLYQRLHGKLWLEALDPGRLAFAGGFRLTPAYLRVKRALDVACALAVVVAAAPLAALIALAIKLESPGPVLFRQERVGQFGRTFTLLKFRSMRADAEAAGPRWARADDPRATRIGRLLRKTHLDELPQALNVLAGDLSFVGPRPERPCFVELLRARIPFYDLRHYVKPGITGWAQVSYPYADSIEDSYEKHQYDLYYGRNVSLALDLRILAMTAAVMVLGRGR